MINAVCSGTRYGYASKCKRILQQVGQFGYWNFIAFLRKNHHKDTSTLRGYKSAMLFVMRLQGREHAMSADDAADLDNILDGHEVLRQGERPRTPRGAIDEKKLQSLVKAARQMSENDLADAFEVANGCALRGGSISNLTRGDVKFEEGVITAPRKDRMLAKARLGTTEEHPIVTIGAEMVLRRRCKGLKDDALLWPNWQATTANRFIAAHAIEHHWNEKCKWDGMHCHRHGAAVNAKRAALDAVKIVGGWRSKASAVHYSRTIRE